MLEKAKVEELLESMLQVAKLIRQRCGYAEGNQSFVPVAIIVAEDGQVQVVGTPHRSHEEKHRVMQKVAAQARQQKSPLVVLVQDARVVKPAEFSLHYGLPETYGEAFERRYHEILDQHDGCLGNCHVSTWQDVLMVVSKSPVLPMQMRMLRYREGVGDTVVWQQEEVLEDGVGGNRLLLQMLPDWWTGTATVQ